MSEVQTVAGAVENSASPAIAAIESLEGRFANVLPAHVPPVKYKQWCLNLIRKAVDPGTTEQAAKQALAWQRVLSSDQGRLSVYSALMEAAGLGLEPGREYHLVPYGGEVTGVTDYKGELRLIGNARRCSVIATLVREKDEFAMRGANCPPRHEADWFGSRGPVTGGYAYADYGRGEYSLVVRMREAPDPDDPSADSFLHHREKAKTKIVWDEWPEAMRLKTLVHQLRKWVAWSPEWIA